MERAPTALHRAVAWAVVALALALLVLGGRTAWRALAPVSRPEVVETSRSEARLHDVTDATPVAGESAAPVESARPESAVIANVSRSRVAPVRRIDEPMEKHPAYVIEGVLRSGTGSYRKRAVLEVVHPDGGVARTDLHFDRRAANGVDWIAPFRLVKPGHGTYVLRPKVSESWPYAIEPPELRVTGSVSGVRFLLRDDVEHVDVDVVVLGAQSTELAGAHYSHRIADVPTVRPHWYTSGWECMPLAGPELLHVPVGTELSWMATAPGHRPATGRCSMTADLKRLEIRLSPGWGVFLDEWSGEEGPVGEIVLDGRLWGFTDPSGSTFVDADAAPQELQVWFGERCALHERLEVWRESAVHSYHHSSSVSVRVPTAQGD